MQVNWKRNAGIFFAGQAVSLFGSALVQYAISWHINLTTGSGVYLTLAVLCGFVPTFLLSPFAGVWADRYNRKILVIVADGCIALATLILAIVVRSGNNTMAPMFVALVIRSFGTAVQNPCVSAILPAVVPEKHLTKINGINSSLQSAIMVFAPMLAAMLIKTTPLYFIFLIDVVTAAIAIFIMLFVFKYEHKPKPEKMKNDYFGELKQGVQYIRSRQYLKLLFIGIFFLNFLCAPIAFLTPLQVTRNYGDDAYFLMMIEIVFSVGMIAGGILIAAWGGFKNRVHTMIFAGVFVAAGTIALGVIRPFVVYLIVFGVCGVAMPAFNTPAVVILQERVEDEYLGRVFSVMTMLSTAAMPLGMLLFGPIGDVVAIEYLLIGTGILLAIGGSILLTRKSILAAGEPVALSDKGDNPA